MKASLPNTKFPFTQHLTQQSEQQAAQKRAFVRRVAQLKGLFEQGDGRTGGSPQAGESSWAASTSQLRSSRDKGPIS